MQVNNKSRLQNNAQYSISKVGTRAYACSLDDWTSCFSLRNKINKKTFNRILMKNNLMLIVVKS